MGVGEEGPTSYIPEWVPCSGCKCELSASTCVCMGVSVCLPGKEGSQLRKLWDEGGHV